MAVRPVKEKMRVTDLPLEILRDIFTYLSIRNFTNFTSCARALLPFCDDTSYWSTQVQRTYRVPSHLNDLRGNSWRALYQKLCTQTQLYTWGENYNAQLGHVSRPLPKYENLNPYLNTVPAATPGQPWIPIYIGTVVDVQCGAHCTILLNSEGNLYVMGNINSSNPRSPHEHKLRPLHFPRDWPMSSAMADWPDTAIQQFSTGSTSVLGLSSTERVWLWEDDKAVLLHFPLVEARKWRILEVQAGHDGGAILIKGKGIAYWDADLESDLMPGHRQESLSPKDRKTVTTTTIPGTGFDHDLASSFVADSLDAEYGQLKHFIIMDDFIIFVTAKHRIFSYHAGHTQQLPSPPQPVELMSLYPPDSDGPTFEVRSIAGSPRDKVMINTVHHGVLYLNNQFLYSYHNLIPDTRNTMPDPERPPTLQHNDVVSIAMGDQHIHALHSNGTITSLGIAASACGALGFPPLLPAPSPLWTPGRTSIDVKPLESTTRRTVRFEPLMQEWLRCVQRNSNKRFEGLETEIQGWNEEEQDQYAENVDQWLEVEGANWVDGTRGRPEGSSPAWQQIPRPASSFGQYSWQQPPQLHQDATYNHHSRKFQPHPSANDDINLPPHFALKVAAGGSHSAALVLVDQFKAKAVRETYVVPAAMVKKEGRGAWAWGKKMLGLAKEVDEREKGRKERWVWEEEALPSRVVRRPVIE